jgi:hypothetical protein
MEIEDRHDPRFMFVCFHRAGFITHVGYQRYISDPDERSFEIDRLPDDLRCIAAIETAE